MKYENDKLGNMMKFYESQTCVERLLPLIPIVARLDGKGFSKFTKGLKRPYDERLSNLMIETTKYLVKETNANCGYTQSDEITLVWYSGDLESKVYFDGRVMKMISDLSAMASVFFNSKLSEYLPEKVGKLPRFDCRVFSVPTLDEAVNAFYWREKDATKNSISMAAQSFYSHKELMNKNSGQKQEMLFQKGVNWNEYPSFFKKGTYVQRKRVFSKFSEEELSKLPPKHNARKDPNFVIERWVIDKVELSPLSKIKNKVDVIIYGQDPIE